MPTADRASAAHWGPGQEAALALEKELLPSNSFPFPSPHAGQITTASSLGLAMGLAMGPIQAL